MNFPSSVIKELEWLINLSSNVTTPFGMNPSVVAVTMNLKDDKDFDRIESKFANRS